MLRLVLLFLLFVFLTRALWRLLSGIIDGIATTFAEAEP